MKKTKIQAKKLTLSREILRSLQIADLQKVAGGFSGDNSCYPVPCNIDMGDMTQGC